MKQRVTQLDVLRDLVLGGRHCRLTVARAGVSLPTADRWLRALLIVPGVRTVREGKTTWYEFRLHMPIRVRVG
jgi:hypothetical protein